MGFESPFTLSGEINLFSYAGSGPEEFYIPSDLKKKTGVTVEVIERPGSSTDSDSDSQVEVRPEQKQWKPSSAEMMIMITLALISLMVALDANVIVTSLAAITRGLHGTTVQAFWVGTSYLLACAVVMPFMASLSDIFGRVPCLVSSLLFFTVGTVVCATSNQFCYLLVGRSIQGIGGGGIIVLSLVIFTDIVPLRFRPKYYGIVQGAWAIGSCFGPIVGGALAQHATWRWVFYLMFPFCAIGLVLVPWVVRLKLKRESTLAEKMARVDWVGGFIFISSMTSFLVAISWGGTQEPWGSWRTIVPMIVGIVGVTVSAIWERYFAKTPFLKRSLFTNPQIFAAYAGAMAQGFLLYSGLYYCSFYFESVLSASPTQTGINLFPVTFALVPTSIIVGALITRLGHFRWSLWSGWALTSAASGLTMLFGIDMPTWKWAVILVFLGFGHGLLLNSLNFAVQAMADKEDAAPAAAMYTFLRSLGMAIGVAVGGSVFQNIMKIKLGALGLPLEIATNAETYIAVVRKLLAEAASLKPTDPVEAAEAAAKAHTLLSAYVYGFRGTFAFLTALAVVAGLASLAIGHYELNHEHVTGHAVARRGGDVEQQASVANEIYTGSTATTVVIVSSNGQ